MEIEWKRRERRKRKMRERGREGETERETEIQREREKSGGSSRYAKLGAALTVDGNNPSVYCLCG